MKAAYGLFAAAADETPECQAALVALCPTDGAIAVVERFEPPAPPGSRAIQRGVLVQMLAEDVEPRQPPFPVLQLGDADSLEMVALASLTRPGPFFERTHQLGEFVGVRIDGRLAAMAGERMRLEGLTEVSGVCVHPDFRGAGYARELTRLVARRILARGERPFLHVYDDNTAAIRLYETLGFRLRAAMRMTVLARA